MNSTPYQICLHISFHNHLPLAILGGNHAFVRTWGRMPQHTLGSRTYIAFLGLINLSLNQVASSNQSGPNLGKNPQPLLSASPLKRGPGDGACLRQAILGCPLQHWGRSCSGTVFHRRWHEQSLSLARIPRESTGNPWESILVTLSRLYQLVFSRCVGSIHLQLRQWPESKNWFRDFNGADTIYRVIN